MQLHTQMYCCLYGLCPMNTEIVSYEHREPIPPIPIKKENKWRVYICIHCIIDYIDYGPTGENSRQKSKVVVASTEQCSNYVVFLSSSSTLFLRDLAQCGEGAARSSVESNSVLLQLPPLSLEAPHLLMTGTRDAQVPLLPKSSCPMFGLRIFPQNVKCLSAAPCAPPTLLSGLSQSPREHRKTFDK